MESKSKKSMNTIVKTASPVVLVAVGAVATACGSTVGWSDAEQGLHDLVIALISFASSALGIVSVWVLANLKGWLEGLKKKKEDKKEDTKEDK